MSRAKCRIFLLAATTATSTVLIVGFDRTAGPVIPSPPENHSRNFVAVTKPSNELPRDADAAAHPSPAALAPLPSKEAISDTVITGKIKAAVHTDPGMAGADLSVNTDHGVVILAGSVKSHEQAGIASAHAQRQDGVMRVDNQLTLAAQ